MILREGSMTLKFRYSKKGHIILIFFSNFGAFSENRSFLNILHLIYWSLIFRFGIFGYFGPFFQKKMPHFYENPSKVLGYQGSVKILMINLISSQKSPTPNISVGSIQKVWIHFYSVLKVL